MLKWIDVPPAWLVFFAAGAWVQSIVFPAGSFGVWSKPVGAGLIVVGVALAVAAVIEFRRHQTTVIPHQTPSAIVTSGIFSRTRNPIYLGDAAILLGLVLWWDAVPSLILVPLFMLLISKRFIDGEEERLKQEFPDQADAYLASTRRWL